MTTLRVAALIASTALAVPSPARSQAPMVSPRLVDVDGTPVRVLTLGLEERASGEPVFVFQSGGGATLDTWDATFVRTIAALAPVVAYDRPGLGGSPYDGESPSPERVAAHLERVLDVLGVGPPYILVGHSWGGPLILHFAGQHPDDVAGLVYLDPSLPHRDPLPTDSAERRVALTQIDSLRARTMSLPEGRGAEVRASYDYWLTPPAQRGIPSNPDVPTAVVLGDLINSPVPASERDAMRANQERRVDNTRAWLEGVDPLHFVVAPYAGHFVHRDAPDLVAEAIRQVLVWSRGRP